MSHALVAISNYFRWIFVCCGNVVHMYSQKSRDMVHALAQHTALVTGVQLNSNNLFQVCVVQYIKHVIMGLNWLCSVLSLLNFV